MVKEPYNQYNVWLVVDSYNNRVPIYRYSVYVALEKVIPHNEGSPGILLEEPIKNTAKLFTAELCGSKLSKEEDTSSWESAPEEHKENLSDIAFSVFTGWLNTNEAKSKKTLREYCRKKLRVFLFAIPVSGLEEMIEKNLTVVYNGQ